MCVKTFQPPALLLPVKHPFALRRWLVAVEFGCGDEGDDHDLLQTNVDFAFAWLELPSPGMALRTHPAPRAPARPAAERPELTDLASPEMGDTGVGGGEAIFVQLCYCVKQNTAKPLKCKCAGARLVFLALRCHTELLMSFMTDVP